MWHQKEGQKPFRSFLTGIFGKSLNLSRPQFSQLYNKGAGLGLGRVSLINTSFIQYLRTYYFSDTIAGTRFQQLNDAGKTPALQCDSREPKMKN